MITKRLIATTTLLVSLGLPLTAFADGDELMLSGKIEQVESDGRIRVQGHQIRVDEDSEIKDQNERTVSPPELVKGVDVEIIYDQGSRGEHAKRITATLMR